MIGLDEIKDSEGNFLTNGILLCSLTNEAK